MGGFYSATPEAMRSVWPLRSAKFHYTRSVPYTYIYQSRWLVEFIISKQEFGYMTTPPLEVFISEPAEVDAEVFNLWLKGHTVEEACRLTKSNEPPISKEFDDFHSLLLSEIQGQYRVFQILESYLQLPPTLFGQRLFQLPLTIKRALIERYYEFDEKVVREFLGKKLSSKNRRELDDISERTGVSLKSCRRQFDNVKRVLRVVDDYEGSLVQNIKKQFLLSDVLAKSYASVVFISSNRFETSKKKLSHLSMQDFTFCANLMIDRWTAGSEGSRALDDDLELDRDFFQELRDLKLNLIDRGWIDRQQKLVLKDLRKKHSTIIPSVDSNFKALSKTITTLGASLIQTKERKDFFGDLIEKLVEPCKQLEWDRQEMDLFLTSIMDTFEECQVAHSKQTGRPAAEDKPWSATYLRFMHTLRECVLRMYHD